jgi:thiamine-monophosphate kinase
MSLPLRQVGENGIISRFRALAAPGLTADVVVGPGDDAAALHTGGDRVLLLTCDMVVEGVHFRRAWATPDQIGWRAMAANLSDIAAMGGEPAAAVASIAAPGDLPAEEVEQIAQGLISAASQYRAALVGGDLVGSPGPLVVDVALTGWVDEHLMLRRRGARPGDALLVTGALGASATGLALRQHMLADDGSPEFARALQAHHKPRPRLAEARAIAESRLATAMMDLSDGLAQDLPRLCGESGVGARVWCQRVPADPAALALAPKLGRDPLELALSGGEDYELLFTCPTAAAPEIAAAVLARTGTAVAVIGDVTDGTGVTFLDASGNAMAPNTGFDHFAAAAGGRP